MRISDGSSDLCSSDLAMKVLGDNVVESMNPADAAAEMWLGLSSDDREATAVFASGRASRAIINQRIQDGLATEGSVKGEGIHLTVRSAERRVGKECVSTCRSRRSPSHEKKKKK